MPVFQPGKGKKGLEHQEYAEKAKEYLLRIGKIDRLVGRMRRLVSELRMEMNGIRMRAEGERVKASPQQDRIGETVAKILDLEQQITAQTNRLIDQKQEALGLIAQLNDPDQQNVLLARYFQFYQWRKIALEMHYCEAAVYKIHTRALTELGKKL